MRKVLTILPFCLIIGQASAAVSDALIFLQSRANLVKFRLADGNRTWSIYSLRRDGNILMWRESNTTLDNKGLFGLSKQEDYAVDVRNLVMPVVIDSKNITFECRPSVACIAVRVHTSVTVAPTLQSSRPDDYVINENRTANTWHFHSVDDAKRAAQAMNDVMKELGAATRRY